MSILDVQELYPDAAARFCSRCPEPSPRSTLMATITLKGNPIETAGNLPAIGSQAPAFTLTRTDLSNCSQDDFAGKTVVLNIFPSIDTSVCAASVRRFNAEAILQKDTVVLCISADLPFAHKRFCEADGLENVIPLSIFRPFTGLRQRLRRHHHHRAAGGIAGQGCGHHQYRRQGGLHRTGAGNRPGTRLPQSHQRTFIVRFDFRSISILTATGSQDGAVADANPPARPSIRKNPCRAARRHRRQAVCNSPPERV